MYHVHIIHSFIRSFVIKIFFCVSVRYAVCWNVLVCMDEVETLTRCWVGGRCVVSAAAAAPVEPVRLPLLSQSVGRKLRVSNSVMVVHAWQEARGDQLSRISLGIISDRKPLHRRGVNFSCSNLSVHMKVSVIQCSDKSTRPVIWETVFIRCDNRLAHTIKSHSLCKDKVHCPSSCKRITYQMFWTSLSLFCPPPLTGCPPVLIVNGQCMVSIESNSVQN